MECSECLGTCIASDNKMLDQLVDRMRASFSVVLTHKKEREEGKQPKTRKVYTYRVRGQPMTTEGHTQFRGQRYCPNAPGQFSQDEWLKRKEEAARKKQGPPQ